MMRAVKTLRQRLPANVGGTLGYAPVHLSDSDDDNNDGYGGRGGEFEFSGRFRGDGVENRDSNSRRIRRRSGSGGSVAGAGGGRRDDNDDGDDDDDDDDDDSLWPPYTPLYTNMKVFRRKRLDASMMYSRAGPCTKICFLTSLWGVSFLTWIGFTLASGSPYIIAKDSEATNLARSHSVFGAAALYFVCACLTGYSWYKSAWGARPLPTMGDRGLP